MKLLKSLLVGLAMTFASPVIADNEYVPLETLTIPYHVFFPSDVSNPKDTMLEMNMTVTMDVMRDDVYIFHMCYDVKKYEDENHEMRPSANVSDMTFVGYFDDSSVQAMFHTFDADSFNLKDHECKAIPFVSKTHKWTLGNFKYVVLDKYNKYAAMLTLQAFEPVKE